MSLASSKFARSVVVALVSVGLVTFVPAPSADAALRVVQKVEHKVLKKVNWQRQNKGKGSLALHTYLRKEARMHSKKMFKKGFYDSTTGEGARNQRIWSNDLGINYICAGVYRSAQPLPHANNAGQVAKTIIKYWKKHGTGKCLFANHVNVAGVGIVRKGKKFWATVITAEDSTPPS